MAVRIRTSVDIGQAISLLSLSIHWVLFLGLRSYSHGHGLLVCLLVFGSRLAEFIALFFVYWVGSIIGMFVHAHGLCIRDFDTLQISSICTWTSFNGYRFLQSAHAKVTMLIECGRVAALLLGQAVLAAIA